jgi:hypothetical protein
VASCFLGALPPVDLRAVCLVRAIVEFRNGTDELNEICFSFIVGRREGIFCGSDPL